MCVLGHVPGVVENARLFAGVTLELLGYAHALRKEAGVVGKVGGCWGEICLVVERLSHCPQDQYGLR